MCAVVVCVHAAAAPIFLLPPTCERVFLMTQFHSTFVPMFFFVCVCLLCKSMTVCENVVRRRPYEKGGCTQLSLGTVRVFIIMWVFDVAAAASKKLKLVNYLK